MLLLKPRMIETKTVLKRSLRSRMNIPFLPSLERLVNASSSRCWVSSSNISFLSLFGDTGACVPLYIPIQIRKELHDPKRAWLQKLV